MSSCAITVLVHKRNEKSETKLSSPPLAKIEIRLIPVSSSDVGHAAVIMIRNKVQLICEIKAIRDKTNL